VQSSLERDIQKTNRLESQDMTGYQVVIVILNDGRHMQDIVPVSGPYFVLQISY
jgi:hypothetical protein